MRVFGSDRSSSNANLHSSVRPFEPSLKDDIRMTQSTQESPQMALKRQSLKDFVLFFVLSFLKILFFVQDPAGQASPLARGVAEKK